MDFSYYEVHLPPCVEEMLRRICQEQAQAPPDFKARQCLALLGEERAMCLLEKLQYWNIRNLSACVIYLAKKEEVSPEESVCSPLSHTSTVRSSQDEDMVPSSPNLEQRQTSLHMALGKLEFRKAFLILSYVGDKKLEKFVSLETIQMLMDLPMISFEAQVWNLIGKECILETERRKNLDWDSQLTYVYQCHVGQEGKVTFKGPYLSKTKTHLQRVLGDENVLNVRFADEAVDGTNPSLFEVYQKIAKEGIRIPIGLRHYQFFVFKDGGKEEKKKNPTSSSVKCYFVCVESIGACGKEKTCTILNKPIRETRATFMHIHTVANLAKYMARFSLILSKTIKLEVNLANVNIQFIEDIRCQNEAGDEMIVDGQPLILTDGTGYISKDLALKCGRNIYKGAPKVYQNGSLQPKFEERSSGVTSCRDLADEPPLLIQFRLFNEGYAIKGTVLVNNLLPPNTIQIRPSMIKVYCDPKRSTAESVNSFEIVGTSNRPKGSDLSKHLITLLNYGGVPREYFTTLVQNALDDAQNVYANKRSALRAALRHGELDNYLSARMILCGIPLDEPFLQDKLSIFMKEERKGFMKGKIPIDECYYLMGTADPTGMLRPDQVCIILDNGQISGKVLVYKNPGLHFGDIHVLTATYVKDLENIVGNAKYAIFFPTNGLRSLADEIANSDFDGDMYWVSRNPQLVDRFKQSEPWPRPLKSKIPQSEEPTKYSPEQLEYELFNKFLNTRFRPSNVIGTAADSWLVYMDRLLTLGDECVEEKFSLKKKMLRLVDIYYDALDAPKSGLTVDIPPGLKPEKFPHFMERENRMYTSKSILGEIYDIVQSFQSKDALPNEVCLLSCFGEVVPRYLEEMWQTRYRQYRKEMCSELSNDDKDLKNAAVDQVILKYKMMVYEAEEFEVSTKNREEIFNEALAIYQIAYKYAKTQGEVGRCGFPWKVAGHALCELYLIKQNENRIVCSPSVLREIFG